MTTTGSISRAELRRQREREQRKRYRPHAAALALVLVALAVSALYPARQLVAKRQRIKALTSESASLDRQIADLKIQRDALQTDAEIERLARRDLGMVRPGEQAFAVVPGQQPVPQRVTQPAATATGDRGVMARWWDALRGAIRVLR